ncbi:MAG TPA: FAD-dependent oxidoreductase, partial [Petrotogaceae bacterium]|nr:FAD-dependent oxidoreductase [Petrotogaceae bacterium]
MKIIVVGGVAGGATAAARLRRLDEKAQITVYERGEYISFANCGLPYHIGDVIQDRDRLLLETPETFKEKNNVTVKVKSNIVKINREKKTVLVKDLITSREYEDSYDFLLLSPGAEPIKPSIAGIDSPNIFTLRNINDMD